jgi:GNAT superfamily N-acetyltransferase
MGVWQVHVPAGRSSPRRCALIRSELHADGARVQFDAHEYARIERDAICVANFGAGNDIALLAVPAHCVPKAPPLSWAERSDNDAHPPATVLEAIDATGARPDVLQASGRTDPIGWVRWYPMTGLIDDIWVAPQLRRHGIATALLYAADVLSAARDWRRLWADGQRSDLGDRLREGGVWRTRAADRTHVTPPPN